MPKTTLAAWPQVQPSSLPAPRIHSKKAACAILGISGSLADQLFRSGELEKIQIARRRIGVRQEAIDDFIARRVAAAQKAVPVISDAPEVEAGIVASAR